MFCFGAIFFSLGATARPATAAEAMSLRSARAEADPTRRHELIEQAQSSLADGGAGEAVLDDLLALLSDDEAEVRRGALVFAEEFGQLVPAVLPRLLPALRAMLGDSSAPVVKRCLLTCGGLLRPALSLVAAGGEALSDEQQALAACLSGLRSDAVEMPSSSALKDPVRTQAVKFCEALILACTPEPPSGEGSGVAGGGTTVGSTSLSEHRIPSLGIFGGETAEACARETLRRLTALLVDPPSPTVLCVAASSLALSIGRARPNTLPSVVQALTSCQARLLPDPADGVARIAIPAAGLANVQQALKSAMLTLARQLHTLPPAALAADDPAVSATGAEAAVAAAAAVAGKDRVERMLFASLVASGATNQLQLLLRQMGREMPRADELRAGSASDSGVVDAHGGPKRPREAGGPSGVAKRQQGGGGLQQSSAVDDILRRLAPEIVAELVIATMPQLPPPPPPPAGTPVAAPPAAGGDGAVSVPRPVPPSELPSLLDGLTDGLLSSATERLLHSSGRRAELHAVLGRLASTQPLLGAYHSRLVEHAVKLPHERLELLLAWAYAEYCEHSTDRYDELIEFVLGALHAALPPNDRVWTKVLLSLPRLPPALMGLLRADVASAGGARLTLGLTTLRDLLLQRDGWRDGCAQLLLDACASDQPAVRSAAVRLVASVAAGEGVAQSADVAALAAGIRAHATALMREGLRSSDEDDTSARMLLYLALCARSPPMLAPLLAGLAGATPEAAAAIQHRLPGLLLQLPVEAVADVLLARLRDEADEPGQDAEAVSSQLLMLVLQTLSDRAAAEGGAMPRALVDEVLELLAAGAHPPGFVVPLLPSLTPPQLAPALHALLRLPPDEMREALALLLHAEPAVAPARQLLVELHTLDPAVVPLKALMDAIQSCMNERAVFTQVELVAALDAIVRLDPLPLLTMRTVIQALVHWPKAVDSIMGMLRHLLGRRVWELPKLWAGFLRCCQMAMPASADIYLAMPRDRLEAALAADAAVRDKLVAHARAHPGDIPQPALAALGIA